MKNGMLLTLEAATEEVGEYRFGLKTMSDGFTVGGGEPLMQHRFVLKLFKSAQSMGIHPALNANGYLGGRLTGRGTRGDPPDSARCPNLESRVTPPPGRDGYRLRPCVRTAPRKSEQVIWLRFLLVPGLRDDPDDIAHIAQFAGGLGNVERVDVLPFHQWADTRGKNLGGLNATVVAP